MNSLTLSRTLVQSCYLVLDALSLIKQQRPRASAAVLHFPLLLSIPENIRVFLCLRERGKNKKRKKPRCTPQPPKHPNTTLVSDTVSPLYEKIEAASTPTRTHERDEGALPTQDANFLLSPTVSPRVLVLGSRFPCALARNQPRSEPFIEPSPRLSLQKSPILFPVSASQACWTRGSRL